MNRSYYNLQRNLKSIFYVLFIAIMGISCQQEERPQMSLQNAPLIPKPNSVVDGSSSFKLKPAMAISYQEGQSLSQKVADQISKEWNDLTGNSLKVNTNQGASKDAIVLKATTVEANREKYNLDINEDQIVISSGSPEGYYRGWQTLKQLIQLNSSNNIGNVYIPTGTINDAPNYEYRGTMLDVARHFFSLAEVKEYIDVFSTYKINYLHLHLSDDQGWRIEIKSWPNLTKHGGSTEVGGGTGGFYTQEDYKELVRYAADRFITIVPEIDMPGHTNAALASYPELNCDGKERELYTGIEVGFSTLCVDKELTYQFVDEVVGEIAAMTPGPYFHMGGDESHVTPKDEYLTFVNKAVAIIKKHGKIPMGWDEFTAGDLEGNSLAQHWHTKENAIRGQEKGGKILLSPAKKAYLDMKYDSTSTLGLHWAALIDVKSGYDWDPDTYIDGLAKENIVGIEAPLWSETIEDLDDIEYLAFPRLLGYAEIGWTPSKDRSWDDYSKRLAKHSGYLQKMGVEFYRSPLVEWETQKVLK